MPLMKWMTSSDKTFSYRNKNRNVKNSKPKTFSDFNLEIRPISSSSSSFGTESFLSYDSLYDGEQGKNKLENNNKNLDISNSTKNTADIMEYQDGPIFHSELKKPFVIPNNSLNEEKSFICSQEKKLAEEIEEKRQMFLKIKEDEEINQKENYNYNNCDIKKGRSQMSEKTCLVELNQNGNGKLNEKNLTPSCIKTLKMTSHGLNEKRLINFNNVEGETENQRKLYEKSEIDFTLRCDQFNKVSPLHRIHGFKRAHSTDQQHLNKTNMSLSLTAPKITKARSFDEARCSNDPAFNTSYSVNTTLKSDYLPNSPSTLSRENWISFEDDTSSTFDHTKDDSSLFDDSQTVEELRLIEEQIDDNTMEMDDSKEMNKNTLKNTKKNEEDKRLLVADYESDISDEIISLDYESEEERKKLRDIPIKQFTDVGLFQASSAVKKEQMQLELNENHTHRELTHLTDTEDMKSLDDYPDKCSKNVWNFWYRYPDRKKRIGSRKWYPVSVNVEGDFIKVNGHTKTGSTIVREIPLHPFYVFTLPTVHAGNRDGKMYSVKLQYVKYKEIRKLKTKTVIEHLPIYTPVLKLATRDFISLREFITKVETIIRHIPTYRDKGITYRHEEIFIDCDDECQFLLSGDGTVVKSNVTVQMRLRVFVTGAPQLKLYLNDFSYKETLLKTKDKFYSEFKSQNNWIYPLNYEYHPCVDLSSSLSEGGVVFIPPDGCSFELLRFRVPQKNSLPILAKSSLEVLAGNSVRINASVQVTGDSKSVRHKRNDVMIYFPIPTSWSVLFVRSRSLNGKRRYIKVNASRKTPLPAISTLNRVTLQVSAGMAKYEPAFGAIVWRLGTLPIMQGGVAADVIHSFQCFLELPFALEMREEFQPYTYVEFNIGHQLASGVSVEEILLSDEKVPDKWVCYRANYTYKISMKLLENGKERVLPLR